MNIKRMPNHAIIEEIVKSECTIKLFQAHRGELIDELKERGVSYEDQINKENDNSRW